MAANSRDRGGDQHSTGEARIGAVVLAAGSSRRMGRDKLLLPWQRCTVIEATIANLRAAGIAVPLVVTSGRSAAVDAAVTAAGAQLVQNPDAEAGEMLGSLQCGLRVLPEAWDAVLVLLGDQPMIGPEILWTVLDAADAARLREVLVVPAHQGRWGHPVLFGREHLPALLALPVGSRPRDHLRARAESLTTVSLSNAPEILADLDTAEDYRRWRGSTQGPTRPSGRGEPST